jgi:hypothetical protein
MPPITPATVTLSLEEFDRMRAELAAVHEAQKNQVSLTGPQVGSLVDEILRVSRDSGYPDLRFKCCQAAQAWLRDFSTSRNKT